MRCRYCGMDSRNPHVCEWCKRQLSDAPQAPAPQGMDLTQPIPQGMDLTQPIPQGMDLTQPVPQGMDLTQPVPQHHFRTALTGEQIPVAPVAAPGYAQPSYPQQGYPQQPYPQQPYAQPAAAGRPPSVMPPSVMPPHMTGIPSRAVSMEMARTYTDSFQTPLGHKVEKCLAIVLPILLASVWIVHSAPLSLPWVVVADMFLVAIAMGGTAAIPSFDDAYLDVSAVFIISFLFGPVVGLVGYSIVCTFKQEGNAAMFALLFSHLLIRFIVMLAFPMGAGDLSLLPTFAMFNMVGFLAISATFAGWILSSFFRPINE